MNKYVITIVKQFTTHNTMKHKVLKLIKIIMIIEMHYIHKDNPLQLHIFHLILPVFT